MKKTLKLIFIMIVFYLLIAVPFKVMVIIPGFSDIRPVTMLGPIYALFGGLPGCIVFALMNLVMDIAGDSLRWSSLAGLAANFLGPFLLMVFWKHMKKRKTELDLKTPLNMLLFMASLIAAAVLEALIITPAVAVNYPEVSAMNFAVSVILNTSVFPICFGIPLIILMKEEMKISFSGL